MVPSSTKQATGKDEDMTIYPIYKKDHPVAPKYAVSVFDPGYLGVGKDFPDQKSSLPNRKKRGQKETPIEEKEYSQSHARERVIIEHTICRIKKYKILAYMFRNKSRKHDRVSDIVSGLVNYRILSSFQIDLIHSHTE